MTRSREGSQTVKPWPPTGFSVRLKAERIKAGLSQRQLASAAGVNVMTISQLERGVSEPGWPLVLALADVLGVRLDFRASAEEIAAAVKEGRRKGGRPRGRPKHAP